MQCVAVANTGAQPGHAAPLAARAARARGALCAPLPLATSLRVSAACGRKMSRPTPCTRSRAPWPRAVPPPPSPAVPGGPSPWMLSQPRCGDAQSPPAHRAARLRMLLSPSPRPWRRLPAPQRDQPPSRARHFCVLRDHCVDTALVLSHRMAPPTALRCLRLYLARSWPPHTIHRGLTERSHVRRAQSPLPVWRRHVAFAAAASIPWQQISLHASYDHLSSGAFLAALQRIPAAKLQHMQHGVLHAWTHHLAPAASARTFYQLLRGRAEFRDRR